MSKFGGDTIKCVRCVKAVYFQEQMTGPGGMYHKSCLTCKECNKKLDSGNLCDNNNEAYCKNCHGRLFGPKGYGFGNTLSTETNTPSKTSAESPVKDSTPEEAAKPTQSEPGSNKGTTLQSLVDKFGGTNKCPKCEKAVYAAESILGPGSLKWHKMCFKCNECNKMLDSSNQAEKEGNIFCRSCHSKKFGQRGYGYGGAVVH